MVSVEPEEDNESFLQAGSEQIQTTKKEGSQERIWEPISAVKSWQKRLT